MKVAELLDKYELTGAALSHALGFNGAEAVNRRRREDQDVPDEWIPKLLEMGYEVDGQAPPMPSETEADLLFREADQAPVAPPGAPQAQLPVKIDYASVAGYIEGAYKLSAHYAISAYDDVLAAVIEEHAAQAGQAWAKWIESEPKVAALLERLMVGTPMGEVIGVHITIVFSYTLARAAAKELTAATHGQAGSNGGNEQASEDQLAGTEA